MAAARHKHSEVLRAHLPMAGARIADLGCGDGSLVRFLAREGARVTGLEPSEAQLARARAAEPAGGEDYVLGRAEDLPFAAASLDAVVFFNSLHHVPVEVQARALAEAARVVRPDGLLYIQEPVAEGAYFELTQPVDDETYVRARAFEALSAAAAGPGLRQELERAYEAPYREADFETFRDRLIAVDPDRRARVAAMEAALRQGFEKVAERRDGAFWFYQPSRLNLLRRVG